MPRSGWVALGAVLAALAATQPWAGRAWLAHPAMWTLIAGTWLAMAAGRRRRTPMADEATGSARPLTVLLVVLAGALLIGARVLIAPPAARAPAVSLPTGSGPWTAAVETVGNPRDGSQVATVRLRDASGAPLVVAITAPPDPQIGVGDVVQLTGPLAPLPTGDYGTWLAESGVDATLASRTLEITGTSGSLQAGIDALRRSAADGLALAVPEPEAGLAAGILIGLRDRVDRDLARAFTTAGASHIVAISGWNIAIVAALVGVALRRWPRRRRSVVTLALIVLYTVLTGASASVVRAALMTSVVTLARESGRAGGAAAALGWAAVVMLVAEPATVGDAGFQLSSLATAGLIAWATPLTRRLAAWRGGLLPGWLCESLGVSFAAEAATLPVVLLAFGRLALLAPVVNLVAVPLVPPAMAAGTLALAGGIGAQAGLPIEVAVLAGLPAWMALTVLVGVVNVAAALPFASATLAPPLNLLGAVLVGTVVGVIAVQPVRSLAGRQLRPLALIARSAGTSLFRGRSHVRADPPGPIRGPNRAGGPSPTRRRNTARARRLLAMTLAAAIAGLVLIAAHRADGTVRIDVLDVGQGDAVLVQGDHGSRMLVDGGPDPARLLVALDDRVPPWDRRIDLLVLTHPHEDHVAGLARLLARYRVGRILEPGMLGPGPGYRAFASWLLAHDRRTERVATGDSIALDSIAFRVLWPDPDAVPRRPPDTGTAINNVSIVLLGTVDGHRFLLMGDVEEEIDPILVQRGLPRVDVLKVAHHGSRTASTDAFLAAARPSIAVVSAGARNPYGHPAPQTLERLRGHGAAVFRTDLSGTVDVALEGHQWVAREEHPARSVASAPLGFVAGATAALPQFRCAVPQPGLADPVAPAGSRTAVAPANRDADAVLYDRADVRARPSGGGPPAPEPRSPALAPPPLARRGGDRRVARRPNRRPRDPDRPPSRGGRGAAARRGQAAPDRRSGVRAPPRRRECRLARAPRRGRAGARHREPPGDPARGGGAASPLVGVRHAGRARRRVCGQAVRPAARVDGRPVRLVGAPLPGRRGSRIGHPGARGRRF